jgi:DNA-binding NarL/FixJ family response regulator
MNPSDWRLVLDLLEQGVVVCDEDLASVRAANREARAMFAALGEDGDARLPRAIRTALDGHVGDERFARAIEVNAPSGRHYFVRARRIPAPPGGVLVLIAEARVRREQVIGVMHERLGLSRRQCELAAMVREGMSSPDIATALGLSDGTVRQYLSRLYEQLAVTGRAQLVAKIDDALAGRSP